MYYSIVYTYKHWLLRRCGLRIVSAQNYVGRARAGVDDGSGFLVWVSVQRTAADHVDYKLLRIMCVFVSYTYIGARASCASRQT